MKPISIFDHLLRQRITKLARRWERLLKSGGFSRLCRHEKERLHRKTRRYVQMPAFARIKPYLTAGIVALLMQASTSFDVQAQFAPIQDNGFGISPISSNEFSVYSFVDIDNDGDLDCFVNDEYGVVAFFENTGTASAPAFQQQAGNFGLQTGYYQIGMAFADLDGDGDYDMMSTGREYYSEVGEFHYWENTGTPEAAQFTTSEINPFGIAISVETQMDYLFFPVFADIDDDGDMDLFASSGKYDYGTVSLLYYENTGSSTNPQFGTQQLNPFGFDGMLGEYGAAFDFVDIDNDGDLDFYHAPYYATTLYYSENTGSATAPAFGANTPIGLSLPSLELYQPIFADIDDDGDEDLFVFEAYGGSLAGAVYYFENTGLPIGIDDSPNDAGSPMLEVYPNPAKNAIFVNPADINLAKNETAMVTLRNLAGQVLEQRQLTNNDVGKPTLRFEISDLAAGVYFVTMERADKVWHGRFVKE